MIDLQAVEAPEFLADPPIAVEAVVERDRLDFVAQVRFRPLRRANLAKAIEAGARHAAEQAQMLDRGAALRLPRGHLFDDRVDGVARDDRSRASMSRKASRKKSRSICCLPILRSSSAIRACARASSDSGAGVAGAASGLARAPSTARLTSALPVQRPKLAIGRPPLVKQLALDLQLLRDRRYPLPSLEPKNHRLFELCRKCAHPLL